MKTLIHQGETFYFHSGRLYDESFIELPEIESRPILLEYFNSIDYSALDENQLLDYVGDLKIHGFYKRCLEILLEKIDNNDYSESFPSTALSIITSCYRGIGQPEKAIEYWKAKRDQYVGCLNVPLLTSISAAYCDLNDYVSARKYANMAYYIQDGGVGYKNELALVYRRINKNLKD